MSAKVDIRGVLEATPDGCVTSCGTVGAASKLIRSLDLGCSGGQYYESLISASVKLATSGSVGDTFQDLDCLDELSAIEFLYVKSTGRIQLMIGAEAATLLGSGANFPGLPTLSTTLVVDGASVPVTFEAGEDTVTEAVNRINASAALVGLAPIATAEGGQIRLTSPTLGSSSSLTVPNDATATAMGFDGGATDTGAGSVIDVEGLLVYQPPRSPNAPTKIQASGQANLDIIAAGRAA